MQSFRVRRGEEKALAVLAAECEKVGIKEEKEKLRRVVGGVMKCSEGPKQEMTCAASSSGRLVGLSWWAGQKLLQQDEPKNSAA